MSECKEHGILALKTGGNSELLCYKCLNLSVSDIKWHYPEYYRIVFPAIKKESFSSRMKKLKY